MTTVFVGGSRRLSRLSADIQRRLNSIVEKGFAVIVGDANGADKAVQRYFADKKYAQVTVFCMTRDCRNNVSGWPTKDIAAPNGARGFAYYSTKDRAMADAASHGFMLWDGESKGTLSNIVTMVRQQKPVVVYFAPTKNFETVRTPADVAQLLARCENAGVKRFERELDLARA